VIMAGKTGRQPDPDTGDAVPLCPVMADTEELSALSVPKGTSLFERRVSLE